MTAVILATVALVLSALLTRVFRHRRRRPDRFELGTVSQQWLLVHKGEDR